MLILRNASIIDGTGAPARTGSILVRDGRIAEAGVVGPVAGAREVDCTGLAAAPGFLDIHSHSDLQVIESRREKADQGVTTEVVGNCGFSAFPCDGHADVVREFAGGIFLGGDDWPFDSCAAYLSRVQAGSKCSSVEALVGHGTVRVSVAGYQHGPLEARLVDRMRGLVRESLEQGAAGMSTGLMYAPGSTAPREELVALCGEVARAGRVYATHMRSYSWRLVEAVDEQIELAREAGCRLQISHLQAVGKANWEKQRIALDHIESARAQGLDVEFDIYPYTAGSTVLTQFLPDWALEGGTPKLLDRLAEAVTRARIASDTVSGLANTWADIFIASVGSERSSDAVGKSLEQIGQERGCAPVDAALDLIAAESAKVNIVSFNQSEENLRELLRHPLCSVISDGFYVNGTPHPRLYGTFPQLLGEICRKRGWMTLEEAVHKVTGKPAARFGLGDRGRIAAGLRADVVVFDAGTIASPATYQAPAQRPSGVRLVLREGRAIAGDLSPVS